MKGNIMELIGICDTCGSRFHMTDGGSVCFRCGSEFCPTCKDLYISETDDTCYRCKFDEMEDE